MVIGFASMYAATSPAGNQCVSIQTARTALSCCAFDAGADAHHNMPLHASNHTRLCCLAPPPSPAPELAKDHPIPCPTLRSSDLAATGYVHRSSNLVANRTHAAFAEKHSGQRLARASETLNARARARTQHIHRRLHGTAASVAVEGTCVCMGVCDTCVRGPMRVTV